MNEYASVKQLWSRSLQSLWEHWQPVSIGVTLFGCFTAIVQYKATQIIQEALSQAVVTVGIDPGILSSITSQTKGAQSTESLLEMIALQQKAMASIDPIAQLGLLQEQAMRTISTLLPIIAVTIIIIGITAYCAMQFYFVMAVQKHKSTTSILLDIVRYIVPMFCLSTWVSIRSFIWVPFIGLILAFIYTPRFSLSGVLLVREKLGIFTAAKQSFMLTRGLWYKIVHQTYSTVTVTTILYYVFSFALRYVEVSITLGTIIRAIFAQLLLAYTVIFVVELSIDIISVKRQRTQFQVNT